MARKKSGLMITLIIQYIMNPPPNLTPSVTPHVAGESRAEDIAECFKSNLDRLDSGGDIQCCIDWDKLY